MFRLDVSSPLSMSHVLVSLSGLTATGTGTGTGTGAGPCPCARMSVSRATPRLLSGVFNFRPLRALLVIHAHAPTPVLPSPVPICAAAPC